VRLLSVAPLIRPSGTFSRGAKVVACGRDGKRILTPVCALAQNDKELHMNHEEG
jgi:hypothetical protein